MTFAPLTLREIEAWMASALGAPANIYDRSRRIVASLQIDAGREPTGLDAKEEKQVRSAIQEAA